VENCKGKNNFKSLALIQQHTKNLGPKVWNKQVQISEIREKYHRIFIQGTVAWDFQRLKNNLTLCKVATSQQMKSRSSKGGPWILHGKNCSLMQNHSDKGEFKFKNPVVASSDFHPILT
jgi:hypothetical protein